MAAKGCSITCTDLNEVEAKKTADEIIKRGGKAIGLRCDVTSEEEVKAAGDAC